MINEGSHFIGVPLIVAARQDAYSLHPAHDLSKILTRHQNDRCMVQAVSGGTLPHFCREQHSHATWNYSQKCQTRKNIRHCRTRLFFCSPLFTSLNSAALNAISARYHCKTRSGEMVTTTKLASGGDSPLVLVSGKRANAKSYKNTCQHPNFSEKKSLV